jgi:hypothetical protein
MGPYLQRGTSLPQVHRATTPTSIWLALALLIGQDLYSGCLGQCEIWFTLETGTNYCVGFVPIVRLNFSHDLK